MGFRVADPSEELDALTRLASMVEQTSPGTRAMVAIDGIDGSGKTTLVGEIARRIDTRPVVIVHADNFLNTASLRNARGRYAPEGHWLDLYDYGALRTLALDPLRPEGTGVHVDASYDLTTDSVITSPVTRSAEVDAVVLVEGLFLHRDELRDYWDMSVFVSVSFEEAVRRIASRDGGNPDPDHVSMQRYIGGNRLYFDQCKPWEQATVVIDNSEPSNPTIVVDHPTSTRPVVRRR